MTGYERIHAANKYLPNIPQCCPNEVSEKARRMNTPEFPYGSGDLENRRSSTLLPEQAIQVLTEIQGPELVGEHPPINLPPASGDETEHTCHLLIAPHRAARPVSAAGDLPTDDVISIESVFRRGQSYFLMAFLGVLFLLLANPYPYARDCSTFAFLERVEQAAVSRDPKRVRHLLRIMLGLSRHCPHTVFGFNGLAGNSLKKAHFVSHRPADEIALYAAQQVAARLPSSLRSAAALIGPALRYPVEIARFGYADTDQCANEAASFVSRLHIHHPSWTFNAAVAVEEYPVLYIAPRDPELRPDGWPSQFGFMEIMGAGVVSTSVLARMVLAGAFGRSDWDRAAGSLRLPSIESIM